jgi:hypothetical protein
MNPAMTVKDLRDFLAKTKLADDAPVLIVSRYCLKVAEGKVLYIDPVNQYGQSQGTDLPMDGKTPALVFMDRSNV